MLRIALFAVLVASAIAFPKLSPRLEGVVYCESAGEVTAVRVPNCVRTPCDVNSGTTVEIEADFKPSEASARLLLTIKAKVGPIEVEVERTTIVAQVAPPGEYTLKHGVAVTDQFKGLTVDLIIELFAESGTKECCAIAGVKIN